MFTAYATIHIKAKHKLHFNYYPNTGVGGYVNCETNR